MLTLLSPTLPTTTGPIYECQAGMEQSDVAACLSVMLVYMYKQV